MPSLETHHHSRRLRRKSLLTASICALVVAVAGASVTAARGANGKSLTIAGVTFFLTDPHFKIVACGSEAAAKSAGNVKVKWYGPTTFDVVKEESVLQSVLLLKPNGVVFAPGSPTAYNATIKKSMSGGTPFAMVDSNLSKPYGLGAWYITPQHITSILEKPLAKMLGPKGTLGIIGLGAGFAGDVARYAPVITALHKDYPGINILPVQYGKADTNVSAQIVQSWLTAHPEINVIYASNGPQSYGVVSALRAAGKLGKVKVVAFDDTPAGINNLKSGAVQMLISQSPYTQGYDATKALIKYLRAHPSSRPVAPGHPNDHVIPLKLITKSNLGAALAQIKACGS
ncbi:MAG TPA: substrate-binding domain-containing protein [Gaiellaceae bacterium]|nr:substrate-binding domain-containing protein [Gaiellaceae bacterium]